MPDSTDETRAQFTEAAFRGLDYVETHPGVPFKFQLNEVREGFPALIFSFSAGNTAACDVFSAMCAALPDAPGAVGEGLRGAFNTFVDFARERNFVTEEPDKMLLTVKSYAQVPVFKPLTFKQR